MQDHTTLELVKPAVRHGPAYLDMIDEYLLAGEGYAYRNIELARENFAQFVHELENSAEGIGYPAGVPAQQTYLLLKDGQQVVGEIRFRPGLTPPYERYFGHAGYNIRPSQQGHGYATRLLALLLDEARQLQLPGLSLIVDHDNPASVRVIKKNGGRLLQTITNPAKAQIRVTDGEIQIVDEVQTGLQWDIYWIDLTTTSEESR